MTSRVQKGGPLFRPVPKSRARTAPSVSRQASVVIDQSREEPINTPIISFVPPLPPLASASSSATPFIEDHRPSLDQQFFPLPSNTSTTNFDSVDLSTPILDLSHPPTRGPLPPVIGSSAVHIRPPSLGLPVAGAGQSLLQQHPPTAEIDSAQITNVPLTAPGTSSVNRGEVMKPPVALTDSNTITPAPDTQEGCQNLSPKAHPKRRKGQDENPKGKKRRRGSKNGDDENTQDGNPSNQKRASSGTPRPRKRAPSPPPYDPDADPGEEIDPTTITMAALCEDTGQGRVSRKAAEILSNHAAWKISNREKRTRMKALMEAKKYGKEDEENEQDQETEQDLSAPSATADESGPSTSQNTATTLDETGNGFDYSQDLAASRYNVQIRIGPNGETVIDEESLVVDRVENDGTDDYTHVIESDHTKFVNSGTYGKRYRGSRWSAEETELFYEALAQYGENYELIAYVLPGRDRKSCKNKFKVEDKRNHARINYSLNNSIPVDMKTLSRMTGKDFSGPVPEIRAPPPKPMVPPSETVPGETDDIPSTSRSTVKKRSRSKSQGIAESGVVVVGEADTFES